MGGRHIRAVGCMLEIEGWVAGGTLEEEEEDEKEEEEEEEECICS